VVALRSVASRARAVHFRAHPRRRVKLRAVLAQPANGWQRDAGVLDLSLGGAKLSFHGRLAVGEKLVVSFFSALLWDPLALPARVAWVLDGKDPGIVWMGVAFEPTDPSSVFALFELVSTVAV